MSESLSDKGPLPCWDCGTVTEFDRLTFGVDCDCEDSRTCVHGLCSECLDWYDGDGVDWEDDEDEEDYEWE